MTESDYEIQIVALSIATILMALFAAFGAAIVKRAEQIFVPHALKYTIPERRVIAIRILAGIVACGGVVKVISLCIAYLQF